MSIIKIKFVSTISAFESEIRVQLTFLKHFQPQKPLSKHDQKKTIFCGAGDSFVSALLGEVFSDFRIKTLDPLDLLTHNQLLHKHHLYLISISGNTISNIKLARKARHATAITTNPKSRLANSCTDIIHLKFDNSGIFTAGSLSFLASALTCISLVHRFKMPRYDMLYEIAYKVAKMQVGKRVHILGNLYSFPLAMFCTAKLSEVLGIDSHYERIEQFVHTGLFSSRKGDTVIIFEKKNKHNEKLVRELRKCGLDSIMIEPPTSDPVGQVIFFTFVSEFLALHLAKKKHKRDCFFVEEKKLRSSSSSMIY